MYKFLKKNLLIIYFSIVFIGILTIWYQLNLEDFWLDEMNSFWVADPNISFEEFLQRQKKSDYHNPLLFNLLLKQFLFSTKYDPNYARYLPFIFGSISIFFFGILSYQIKKDNSFLLTTLLASLSIYLIKYSQEVRPYSLLLMLSIINISLYYLILNKTYRKTIYNYTLLLSFIIVSVLNYSTNPFALIILFSQITNSFINFFFFNKKDKTFFFLLIPILSLYLLFNFNYLIYQISFNSYELSDDIVNVIDGLYFPRFFGSKIMGYIYLFTLIYLIIFNRKLLFYKSSNYLLLLIILIFSYLIPLVYSLIKTPVLHDRYIIFVIIPVILLISCLTNEINLKKIKNFIIFFILISTLTNHYIEIFQRDIKKPEFKEIIKYIKKNNNEIHIVYYDNTESSFLVLNYLKNLTPTIQNDFNFTEFNNNLPKDLKKFWLICYTPQVNFDCNINNSKNLKLINAKKKYLIEAKLFKLN